MFCGSAAESVRCLQLITSHETDPLFYWLVDQVQFCKPLTSSQLFSPLMCALKPQTRTIMQQYGDWYTGRWWVGCYIWYSKEGIGRGNSPSRPLLAVPHVTAHPSTASVPTSYYSMWHFALLKATGFRCCR